MSARKVFGVRKMRSSWPFGAVGLVIIAIALLAAPERVEGPVLAPISPGHALAVPDSIALIPLLAGLAWLYWGVWVRRHRLYDTMRTSPGKGSLGVFAAGLGNGLLLASAFSTFWVVGHRRDAVLGDDDRRCGGRDAGMISGRRDWSNFLRKRGIYKMMRLHVFADQDGALTAEWTCNEITSHQV